MNIMNHNDEMASPVTSCHDLSMADPPLTQCQPGSAADRTDGIKDGNVEECRERFLSEKIKYSKLVFILIQ